MQATNNNQIQAAPFWASWLGVIAIIFGILSTASHGTEVMKQFVIKPDSAAVQGKPLKCPEDELEEEGISMEECELMGTTVKNMIVSRPDWFRHFQILMSIAGTLLAMGSIFIGIALLDYRSWVVTPAILIFGALAGIDIVTFLAVVNTGPLFRAMYLQQILLWFFIHTLMTAGAIAGQHEAQST